MLEPDGSPMMSFDAECSLYSLLLNFIGCRCTDADWLWYRDRHGVTQRVVATWWRVGDVLVEFKIEATNVAGVLFWRW